jgi:uncharacterized protein YutE (UPF0331/DUF86 family)
VSDDTVLNKVSIVERCVGRVREEFRGDTARLDNQTVQDAIVLNLQRACETAIDLAMHVIARDRLGLPQDSRHGFTLLEEARVLDHGLAERMRRMVGFRNVAVHEYTALSRPILENILTSHLDDFAAFCTAIMRHE